MADPVKIGAIFTHGIPAPLFDIGGRRRLTRIASWPQDYRKFALAGGARHLHY